MFNLLFFSGNLSSTLEKDGNIIIRIYVWKVFCFLQTIIELSLMALIEFKLLLQLYILEKIELSVSLWNVLERNC